MKNKKILLMLFLGIGVSVHLVNMINGSWENNDWNWFLFIGCIVGIINLILDKRNDINNFFYVSNRDNTVSVIDINTNTVISTIKVGNKPQPPIVIGKFLYVQNILDNTISVIDTCSNIVIETITNN